MSALSPQLPSGRPLMLLPPSWALPVRSHSKARPQSGWATTRRRSAPLTEPYPFPVFRDEFDFRPLLLSVAQDRVRRRDPGRSRDPSTADIAQGLSDAVNTIPTAHNLDIVILSGGVFQNVLRPEDLNFFGETTRRTVDRPRRSRRTMAESAWDRPHSRHLASCSSAR